MIKQILLSFFLTVLSSYLNAKNLKISSQSSSKISKMEKFLLIDNLDEVLSLIKADSKCVKKDFLPKFINITLTSDRLRPLRPKDQERAPILRKKIVKFALNHGADINAVNRNGCSALHLAIIGQFFDIMKYLIDHGANINTKDIAGFSALDFALESHHFDTVKFLVDNGASLDIKAQSFIIAIKNNSIRIIKYLIKNGFKIDKENKKNISFLIPAIENKNFELVQYLVDNGADVNKKGVFNLTPLHFSVMMGDDSIMKYLIEQGVDINAKDIEDLTPLVFAVVQEDGTNLPMAKYLIKHGADVNAKNKYGYNILHLLIIIHGEKLDWVKYLIDCDANINQKTITEGYTPLHIAIASDHPQLIKQLIEAGADPKIKDNHNKTPYDLLLEKNYRQEIKDFIKYDELVNYLNSLM